MLRTNRVPGLLSLLICSGLLVITCGDGEVKVPTSPELEFPDNQLLVTLDRTDWTMSSRPVQVSNLDERAKLLWHNLPDNWPVGVVDEGWSEKPATPPVRLPMATTFRIIYRPSSGQQSWAGIVTRFAHAVNPDSVKGFEIRALGDHGVIHVDMGHIDDDVTNDGLYYSEDRDHNGVVDETEDVGLDGLADEDEPGYDPITNPDPNGDNYFFLGEGKCPVAADKCDSLADAQQNSLSPSFYEWLNGTEGNRNDLGALADPDKEWPGQAAETSNDYFSVSVDLADDACVVPGSENSFGWKTIRIPADSGAVDTVVGDTRKRSNCWRDVNRIRIWFESDGSSAVEDTVEIAGMYFLQDVRSTDDSGAIMVHEYTRDYEYAEGRIFDLGYPGEFGPYDTVIDLRMFETGGDNRPADDTVDCLLQIYPDSVDTGINPWDDPYATQSDSAAMTEMTDFNYYSFLYGGWAPHVELRHGRASGEMIGCWMVVRRYSEDGSTFLRQDTIGDVSDDQLYVLKSLRANNAAYSPTQMTWSLMWRNIYPIRPGMPLSELNLQIFKGLVGTEGDSANLSYQTSGPVNEGSYIQILGLDQYNRQQQNIPDDMVDERTTVYRPDEGLIIFPHRRPFDTDTTFEYNDGSSSAPLAVLVPQIYDGSSDQVKMDASQYYLSSTWVTYSAVIHLGRTNLQEGSERVWFHGRLLVRGIDYNIDYRNGVLVLLGPEADYIGSEVTVQYLPYPKF